MARVYVAECVHCRGTITDESGGWTHVWDGYEHRAVADSSTIRESHFQPERSIETNESLMTDFVLGQIDLMAGQIATHKRMHAWIDKYQPQWRECPECRDMAQTMIDSILLEVERSTETPVEEQD